MAPIIDGWCHSVSHIIDVTVWHIIGATVWYSIGHIIGVLRDRCPALVAVLLGSFPEFDTSVPMLLLHNIRS